MRKSRKVLTSVLTLAAAATLLVGCSSVGQVGGASSSTKPGEKFKIALVSKVQGISWFQRMSQGVTKFNAANSSKAHAWQTGPDTADPAKQVQIIQNLIAQGVNAIIVVPNDPQALVPVLTQARAKGILVITHEAPNLVGTKAIDYDIEAFDNKQFGALFGEELAKSMGGSGQMVGMVGSLTSTTHMAWYNAALAYLAKHYPNIKPVTAQPYEDNNNDATARTNALEILNAYPNLKGYIGTSVSAGSNMAAVLQQKNITGVSEVALSLPSIAGPYLEQGWIKYAQAWDPAGAGYAADALALDILEKRSIKTGLNLGYKGYDHMVVSGQLVTGQATLEMHKGDYANKQYPF